MSDTDIIDRCRALFGDQFECTMPTSTTEVASRAEMLRQRMRQLIGPVPDPVELQSEVVRESRYRDRIEYYITYMSEDGDPVPAYLLVPRAGTGPFPAVVAHHQCNIDCDIGKDAVVGRTVDRPDQAYGLELVRRGFVVLAPDTKSCGERPATGFRELGQCEQTNEFKWQHCYWGGHISPTLNVRSFTIKQFLDSKVAVDYLVSRSDLVDPCRIGMIGHSQGAGITLIAVAHDGRIKAGVASCGAVGGLSEKWLRLYGEPPNGDGLWFHEMLELVAPRALFVTHGKKEGWLSGLDPDRFFAARKWAFDYGRDIYRIGGHDPNCLQEIAFDGPHCFPEDVRLRSYQFLEARLGN